MNRVKKLVSVSLAGVLLAGALAGCTTPAQSDPTVSPAPVPVGEDIAMQLTGIARDKAIATVDGEPITTEEYLFWLANSISVQMQSGQLADEAAWAGEIDGVPAVDFLKNDAMETAKLYRIIQTKAAQEGVTPTEENMAEMNGQLQEMTTSLATNGMTLQQWLDMRAISEAGFRSLNTVFYLNTALMTAYSAEGGQLVPNEERLQAMLDESGIYNCKHILLATGNEDGSMKSPEEQVAVKLEADALVAQIKAAADPAAEFDKVMNERSEDGRDPATGALYAPEGYLSMPGQMVAEFEDAALSLAVGEISDAVQSEFGFHIIMRLSADTAETREMYPSYGMGVMTEQWAKEAKVETTPEYDSINVKDFYDKLQTLIDERMAAAEAVVAATASPAPTAEPSAPVKTPAPVETPAPVG